MGKKVNKTNEDKYEDLLESVSSLLDEETDSESSSSSGLEGLQKRARELKRRFLLHKNHADRHNLKKICEYGLKVIKKITTATGKIDLSALEDDLDNAEVDLDLCEQEFQKDISRYDNLLQLLNKHELPKAKEQDFMLKIKNAKIDIYNATDSPEDLQSEYKKMVSHKEDNNKRRKVLDRLRNSLKQDIKQSISLNQYVKDDIIRMIDTDLNINNMEQFIGDIKIFIQCCIDWYKLDFNLFCSYFDIEDALMKEYFRNFGNGPKSVSDIRKYIDFQERVKKRLLYKEEHPIEFGDAYYDLCRDRYTNPHYKYTQVRSNSLYSIPGNEIMMMAIYYYKIAADKGDKYAMYRMYLCNGDVDYLQKSAELGYPEACYYMGRVRSGANNYSDAFKWYKKGADLGNPDAQYQMGDFYLCAIDGIVQQDDKEAAKWYIKAAEQGHVDAMGKLTSYPKMFPYINKAKVIEMLRKKAREGDQKAASHLKILKESVW